MSELDDHHALGEVVLAGGGRLLSSPAVRGYPAAAPGLAELLQASPRLGGRVADVSGSAGGGVLAAGEASTVRVLEPSAAACEAARRCFAGDPRVTVAPGLPWDLPPASFDAVVALPPTDRGNDRVAVELAACARALDRHGSVFLAMHKDQGARRYEARAAELFGRVEVVARSRGWRVVVLAEPRQAAAEQALAASAGEAGAGDPGDTNPEDTDPEGVVPEVPPEPSGVAGHSQPWRRFRAMERAWWALPGVFAARGLDAGSAELLVALEELGEWPFDGAEVLDLGCGTGLLSAAALDAGAAAVTAADDDLAAVRSSRRNLAGMPARVLHSDLGAALPEDLRFDVVVANPPFHVGKQVRLPLSRAFVATAHARLRPGGTLLMVANRALPYERELATWRRYQTLRSTAAFKVLQAWR